MNGQRRLLLLWAVMLLMATLCPCAQSRRGASGRGGAKGAGMGPKPPLASWSRGASGMGLKLAGAAAAGALGGAALGYGVGSLRRGHGYAHGHDGGGSRFSNVEGPGFRNQSRWGFYRGASSGGPVASVPVLLASLVALVLGKWTGGH